MLTLPHLFALMAGAAALTFANPRARDEASTKLTELPPAVRATIETHLKDAEIEGIENEGSGDQVRYEIEFERGDDEGSLEVDAAGNLLEFELEVSPGSLPKAVRKALRKRSDRAKIREAELVVRESYEVEVALPGGGNFEMHVSAAGHDEYTAEDASPRADSKGEDDESEDEDHPEPKSKKDQADGESDDEEDSEDESDDENSSDDGSDDEEILGRLHLPSAVRAAVFAQTDLGQIAEVEFKSARLLDCYEVEVEHGTHERSLTLTSAGDLIEIEDSVELERLPAFVLAAVKKIAPEGKVVEAERVRAYSYEIEIAIGKRHRELEFDAAGGLLRH